MKRKSDQGGILRRGSACLSCRRRKLRCDGTRPVCSPCNTMKRSQECKYDDSGRKSRTQTLREKKAALEAKVLELESNHKPLAIPSASATWPRLSYNNDFVDPHFSNPSIQSIDLNFWNGDEFDATLAGAQGGNPYSFPFDSALDFRLCASPTSFDHATMPHQFDSTISTNTAVQPLVVPLRAFSESSGASTHDCLSDRILHDSSPSLIRSREVHEVLIQSFIEHRKQFCFYSNTSRFDPSSSPSIYQNNPPNVGLMSAIYLVGSFFTQIPGLENQLLEQTLHEVSRTLHNGEQSSDMVQALCLLAQYFFFTARDVEGNRHLTAAKRIAMDVGLHQVSPVATFPFEPEYSFDTTSQNWLERSAIFWQLYMVSNCWSISDDCCVASSTLSAPCRHISTPLPVEEGAAFETVVGNSSIHGLFEDEDFRPKKLSIMGFKAMASSIFDRSLRVHNTVLRDETTWTYRRQTENGLARLSELFQPQLLRDSTFSAERSSVDTDVYAVQTLMVASTIHLHLDTTLDLKISGAVRTVVELLNQLTEEDYQFLDPVLPVCWSSIAQVIHGMLDTAKLKIETNGPCASLNYAVHVLDQCIQRLLSALKSMARIIPLADILLRNLESSHSTLYPGLQKTLPHPNVEQNFISLWP